MSFPWADYMRLGLGVLRLSPREFWAATPREIAAAFSGARREAMGRAGLAALMQRFPDELP
jgi:uncharacterized phage protein (TIGR02216 family)